MTKTALLDVNVLTALLWPAHEHHAAAHHWMNKRANAAWSTCALTQLGFVRLVSNPAFSRESLLPAEASRLLEKNLSHPNHRFWVADITVPHALQPFGSRMQGHRQATDAYLLALAHNNGGVLATFDRGLRSLVSGEIERNLEIVPAG